MKIRRLARNKRRADAAELATALQAIKRQDEEIADLRGELDRAYDTIDRMGDVLACHGRERRHLESVASEVA